MNYQRRKRTARIVVKLCEALPAILGIRKLEFAHLQKKHSVNLILLEKISNMYKHPQEMAQVRQSVSLDHYELYKFCISNAQHNMHEFKLLSDSMSFDYEGELEKISLYLLTFPEEKNYTEALDNEIVLILRKFQEYKMAIRNLELALVSIDTEIEILKQDYEAFLQMTGS